MASEFCLSVTKYFLFLFNLIFFFLGLSLLGWGVWIICSESSFLISAPSYLPLSNFSYLLVISGSVTLLLGFFGCLGALKEVKCMLAVYFLLLTILLAAQMICTVLLFTQRRAFENSLEGHVIGLIKSFGKNDSSQQPFYTPIDFLQREAQCCGWNGKTDWNVVPCSCYSTNATNNSTDQSSNSCPCGSFSNNTCWVHEKNCRYVIENWINAHFMIILGVVLALALVEICGTILSMCLYNWISVDYSMSK